MKRSLQESKVVLFDFDGTLADGISLMREIYNEMAGKRRWRLIEESDLPILRKMNSSQAMRWAGVSPWQVPKALAEGVKLFGKRAAEINLFDGVEDMISLLHKNGFALFVLSSNRKTTVESILKRHHIGDKMTVLHSAPLFGKHLAVRRFLKHHKINREDIWMVGDEVRDIKAAKTAGVRIVAVSWGLQDESLLAQNKPFAMAAKPKDIAKIIIKFSLRPKQRILKSLFGRRIL